MSADTSPQLFRRTTAAKELPDRGVHSGAPDCLLCGGVGHRKVTPDQAGWERRPQEGSKAWWVPKTENGPGAIYRFDPAAEESIFRPCPCKELIFDDQKSGESASGKDT